MIEFKNRIEQIALNHKYIKSFNYGSDFDIAVDKSNTYPMVFLEFPFMIDYDLESPNGIDNLTVGLMILVSINSDDIANDYIAMARAKEIGDSIIEYINLFCDDFKIEDATGMGIREYSDDSLAGMRYDLIINLPRTCIIDLKEYFNEV